MQRFVVQHSEHGVEDFFHITKIDRPAHHLIQRCRQVQAQGVGVAMQLAALAAHRRGFEAQRAVHGHVFPDLVVRAVIHGAATGCFENRDLLQCGQRGLEAAPDPAGHDLTGRVLQTGQGIEAGMVQFLMQGEPSWRPRARNGHLTQSVHAG